MPFPLPLAGQFISDDSTLACKTNQLKMGREAEEVITNLQIQNPKAKTYGIDFQVAEKPLGNFTSCF